MRVIVYQASDTSALSKNFTRCTYKILNFIHI